LPVGSLWLKFYVAILAATYASALFSGFATLTPFTRSALPGHRTRAAHLQKFATQSAPRVFRVHIEKVNEPVVPVIFDANRHSITLKAFANSSQGCALATLGIKGTTFY
jgi:hypothetical protein